MTQVHLSICLAQMSKKATCDSMLGKNNPHSIAYLNEEIAVFQTWFLSDFKLDTILGIFAKQILCTYLQKKKNSFPQLDFYFTNFAYMSLCL